VGRIVPGGVVLPQRNLANNHSACRPFAEELTTFPGMHCPDGVRVDWREGDPIPPSTWTSCPVGSYPVALGEEEAAGIPLDECAPCPPGTAKRFAGTDRCAPCGEGTFAGGGAVECSLCPLNTESAPYNSSVVEYRGSPQQEFFTPQRFGPTECVPCAPGFSRSLDEAVCPTPFNPEIGIKLKSHGIS